MSNKLVTGDALNDILGSVKDYVDYNDLDFYDTTYEDKFPLPELTVTMNNIDEADVVRIINTYFFIPKE